MWQQFQGHSYETRAQTWTEVWGNEVSPGSMSTCLSYTHIYTYTYQNLIKCDHSSLVDHFDRFIESDLRLVQWLEHRAVHSNLFCCAHLSLANNQIDACLYDKEIYTCTQKIQCCHLAACVFFQWAYCCWEDKHSIEGTQSCNPLFKLCWENHCCQAMAHQRCTHTWHNKLCLHSPLV